MINPRIYGLTSIFRDGLSVHLAGRFGFLAGGGRVCGPAVASGGPMHPYPAPGGLLPWAASSQGDFFLWTTSPAGPEDWTVTVASRNGGWWHYTGGAVQFLADLVSGALEPWALPRVRPEITWVGK
ncbi:hypothetical protein [Kitasatospora griseola]|uniref:hypothetical protein n=1 Tax=Kitasatospora griseola TaxID=2064 RepID=UPI0038109072